MTFVELKQRLDLYEKLMRLDKPIGTLLLLWPTLWALWIATGGQPHWLLVWIFALGTLLMRSAGCVINDYADRDFDPHVERTKDRPLAAGTVSTREALILAAGLAFCAFLLVLPIFSDGLVADADCAVSCRQLSLHQALLRPAAGLSRRRLRLRHSDGLRRGNRRGRHAGLDPAGRQHLLGAGLRHRIRDGRPRRRSQDRHPHLGHHLRPFRCRRGDALLRDHARSSWPRSAGICTTALGISAAWWSPPRWPAITTR